MSTDSDDRDRMMGAECLRVGEFQQGALRRWRGQRRWLAMSALGEHGHVIGEEFVELMRALSSKKPDEIEILDAAADLLYTVYGLCWHMDVPIAAALDEVHASNMTKVGGKIVNGKLKKPKGFKPPNLARIIEEYHK